MSGGRRGMRNVEKGRNFAIARLLAIGACLRMWVDTIDGTQFAGWAEDTVNPEWNSCRKNFPPPSWEHYNAVSSPNGWTEQHTLFRLGVPALWDGAFRPATGTATSGSFPSGWG